MNTCRRCKTEFESNYCPNCGLKHSEVIRMGGIKEIIFSKFKTVISLLLLLVLTLGSFMPMFSVDVDEISYTDSIEEGRFTSNIDSGRVNLSLLSAVNILLNIKDINVIMSVQNNDAAIVDLKAEIQDCTEKISQSSDSEAKERYQNKIKQSQDHIEKLEKENEYYLRDMDLDEVSELEMSLSKQSFLNSLTLCYIVKDTFDVGNVFEEKEDEGKGFLVKFGAWLVSMVALAAVLLTPVFFTIIFVRKVKEFLKQKDDCGYVEILNIVSSPFCTFFTLASVGCILLASWSMPYSYFIGYGACISFAAIFVMRILAVAFDTTVKCNEEKNRYILLRNILNVVSMAILIVVVLVYSSLGLWYEIAESAEIFEGLSESNDASKTTVVIIMELVYIALAIGFVFGYLSLKSVGTSCEDANLKSNRTSIAVVLLAVTIVPLLFTVSSAAKQYEKYEDGKISFHLDAYTDGESADYAKYKEITSEIELMDELEDELKKEYKSESDKEQKKFLKAGLNSIKLEKKYCKKNIEKIGTNQILKLVVCITLAVLNLGALGVVSYNESLNEKKSKEQLLKDIHEEE